MDAFQTKLKDVYLITNEIYEDERGSFTESFNIKDIQKNVGPYQFVQDCYSISNKNVIRGLHYQIKHSQGKLVRCISGKIYDVIVDLRKDSETFGQWDGIYLEPGKNQIWIPPGFAHGFRSLEENTKVFYKVTDYRFVEYERVLLWNDKTLNIDWKPEELNVEFCISEKDLNGDVFDFCDKYEYTKYN